MTEEQKLLPDIPVLSEYTVVKQQLTEKIAKLNAIEFLTKENEKAVKTGIAEINKVKDRISRYRIDETNKFLAYIQPYVDKCKELETLCTEGLSSIKAKVKELELKEKQDKKEVVSNLFEALITANFDQRQAKLLKLEMFFVERYTNKTCPLTMVERELQDWMNKIKNDFGFIERNTDEPEAILAIYLKNGLNLTSAIEEYQNRFANEAEIKAAMAIEIEKANQTFEKKLDVTIKIRQLPKSKVQALQVFLDGLEVEFEVEVCK